MCLKYYDETKTLLSYKFTLVNVICDVLVTLSLSVFSVLVWAILIPGEKSEKTPVVLSLERDDCSVKCATSGMLVMKNFNNNDLVKEGDLLFMLDTTALESEKKNLENRLCELECIINGAKIYAPVSGRIKDSSELNVGDYVCSGEEVIKIVP
ncbi:MAG: biotin/lipoyl-binding protein [Treponema sp.]|nr:biotin/lipoyl-binding protein [Treponema sp.]